MSGIAHIDPYTLGDSAAGIAKAARDGADGIDLNTRTCKANRWNLSGRRHIVLLHWTEWWKHGYEPKPGTSVPLKPIEQLSLAQVRNLRSIDGHHEVLTAAEAVLVCRHYGLIPFFEMKPSIWPKQALEALRDFAKRHHHPVVFMTIQRNGKTVKGRNAWEKSALKRMQTVKNLGIPAMLLWRGAFSESRWAPAITAIKNRPGYGSVLSARELIAKLKKEYGL